MFDAESWQGRTVGYGGELRCGHQVAVKFGAWDTHPQGESSQPNPEKRWGFLGEVVERNDFWLEQGSRFELVVATRDGDVLRFTDCRRVFNDEKVGVWGAGVPEALPREVVFP